MVYCHKCGKHHKANAKFCHHCGAKIASNSENVKVKNDYKSFFFIGAIALIIIFLIIFLLLNGKSTIGVNPIQKECPYECCSYGEFKEKICSSLYECKNNVCKPQDNDNDGLTDIEEKQIGTNPNLYDSDGDTLSDYQEYKVLHTNPLNPNTDGDRYKDNEDSKPNIKNSAVITVVGSNKNWNWNYINILVAVVGGAVVNPDLVIAEPTLSIDVSNNGDDYTSYVNFDIIFEVSKTEIDRKSVSLSKLDSGQRRIETYKKEIKAGNFPSMLINLVLKKTSDWDIKIENLDYEKY